MTESELDSLEPGDSVFHKAFGYGRIVDMDSSYVEVAFDNDDRKKKPSRKFMFVLPGTADDRLGGFWWCSTRP